MMHKPYYTNSNSPKRIRANIYRNKRDIFFAVKKHFPRFVKHLIEDLLALEHYSEEEIAFASGLTLDVVRNILNNNYNKLRRREFQALLHLYTHVFCGWTSHQMDIQE